MSSRATEDSVCALRAYERVSVSVCCWYSVEELLLHFINHPSLPPSSISPFLRSLPSLHLLVLISFIPRPAISCNLLQHTPFPTSSLYAMSTRAAFSSSASVPQRYMPGDQFQEGIVAHDSSDWPNPYADQATVGAWCGVEKVKMVPAFILPLRPNACFTFCYCRSPLRP